MKTIITFLSMLFFTVVFAQDKIYVHTATSENTSGHITYIDHPDLNGNPNAGIVYVHTWNPNGLPSAYNNNVTGLWYSNSTNQWAIYNEDTSIDMVDGSHYMVYIANNSNNVITHVTNAGNQGSFGGYTTVIDHPLLNSSDPGPFAVMSHYYNPNQVYNDQNFGFYYDDDLDKRGIYDENASPGIPSGAGFKVLINGEGVTRFRHTATTDNTSGHITTINHPSLNGDPNATFVFSHYWGANGIDSQKSLNAVTSVYYSGGFWRIYCEDTTTPIPESITFDIIVAPQEVLAVEENQLATNITMYPNPANDTVTFNSREAISSINIYNILGQEVKQISGNNNTDLTINISELAAGNYIAKVQAGTAVQSVKLIKL